MFSGCLTEKLAIVYFFCYRLLLFIASSLRRITFIGIAFGSDCISCKPTH